jgi:hypothetical protein
VSAEPVGQDVTTEVRLAVAAAGAARATPGVVRLQPGLWGLVQQLTRELWERATGQCYPDVGGVRVSLGGGAATVEIALVTDARFEAASVAVAAQRAAADAVGLAAGADGPELRSVAVHISEISLTGLLNGAPSA